MRTKEIRPSFGGGGRDRKKDFGPRMNHRIRVPQVRVIGAEGEQVGVIDTSKAMAMANEVGLDLVEVDPNAKPPVCKIMDYGKFKYIQQKKKHESKKNQIVVHLKEIKMSPNIDEHDIQVKMNHVRRFLDHKDKAKITVQFRGREMQHVDRGRTLLDRILRDLADVSIVDQPPKIEGRTISMILAPGKGGVVAGQVKTSLADKITAKLKPVIKPEEAKAEVVVSEVAVENKP